MGSKMMALMLSSLGLASIAGCLTPDSDASAAATTEQAPAGSETTDASVVLQLEIERGHTVTFYEPAPGGLYLAERMAPGQAFALDRKAASDALAAFARLRPQAEVPAALRAAYDRARALEGGPATEASASGGGEPAAAKGTLEPSFTSSSSAANFVNNDGGCDWGPRWSTCRVNWANGYFASAGGATSGACIVDHYAGNGVTIQITAGASVTTTFQAVATVVQYSLGTPGASVTRRIDILNASGDSFHVGCNWGN